MSTRSPTAVSRSLLLVAVLVAVGACGRKAQPPAGSSAVAVASHAPSGQLGLPPSEDELRTLDESAHKVFDQVVKSEASACGKGHSLLDSAKHDASCRASAYAVRYVARLAQAGSPAAEISEKLTQRFRAPEVPRIDVSEAPSKGNPKARVTVVEFADYTCDHCKQAQAFLPTLLAEYPQDVVLYFKHFPLGANRGGFNAALGAAGAQRQGKFWEFSDKVWEHSPQIAPFVLESIAKEIGLDFDRWYNDIGQEEFREHVQRDRAEARSLAIQRTPAFFINGRRFSDQVDLPNLRDWIDQELGR